MPQGHRKLTTKKPKDVVIKKGDDKIKKKAPKLKKGAMKIAPKKKSKREEIKFKEMIKKDYNKALELEMAEKAGTDNLKVVKGESTK